MDTPIFSSSFVYLQANQKQDEEKMAEEKVHDFTLLSLISWSFVIPKIC
jgi:hypothetical protein